MTDGRTKSYAEQLVDAKAEQARLVELFDKTANKLTDVQQKRYQKIQQLGADIV